MMITNRSRSAMLSLLVAITACSSDDQENKGATPVVPTAPRRDPRFDPVVDILTHELEQNQASGVSIAVMEHGVVTWAEGFGSASPDKDVPIRPDTTFQIGSTTKQLTAMAVLAQVDQGLYALDDTVAQVLPKFSLTANPEWAEHATVRHLLSHQSGLVDDIQVHGRSDDGGLAAFYYDVYAKTKWAMNPPGQFWNYSNPNFDLAGLILEEHDPAGRTYPEIISETLFAPLGMKRSFARIADAKAAGNYADSVGTHPDDFRLGVFPDIELGEPRSLSIDELPDVASQRPSGIATFSTPTDMCRWGYFVMHGQQSILSDATRQQLTTAALPTQLSERTSYGFGEFVWQEFPLSGDPLLAKQYYPIEVWEHGGNTFSFTSSLVIVPKYDLVLSILSNGESSVHAATQEAVLRAALSPLPAPSAYMGSPFDASRLPELAGHYFDPNVAGDIYITEGGANGLQVSIPAFEERGFHVEPDLIPSSSQLWFVQVGDLPLDMTFIVDAQGAPTPWLRTRYFVAERVAE